MLTSAQHGGELPASHPCRFIPGQEPLLRTELEEVLQKTEISYASRKSNHDSLVVQSIV